MCPKSSAKARLDSTRRDTGNPTSVNVTTNNPSTAPAKTLNQKNREITVRSGMNSTRRNTGSSSLAVNLVATTSNTSSPIVVKVNMRKNSWFKNQEEINQPMLDTLIPIGPKDNKKLTLAIDTKVGNSNVVVSGWKGGNYRQIKTIYFATIKRQNSMRVTTPISGIQYPDLSNEISESEVRQSLKNTCTGKRVLFHGYHNDSAILGLNEDELEALNIEIFDTQSLYRDSKDRTIGLQRHDEFWFESKMLKSKGNLHLPINGHNPERDARLTLQLYRLHYKLLEEYGNVPTGDYIHVQLIYK